MSNKSSSYDSSDALLIQNDEGLIFSMGVWLPLNWVGVDSIMVANGGVPGHCHGPSTTL